MVSIIVTVDKNWAISKAHKPLISIPDDAKFIRDTTNGNVVIMGRHTFEFSFGGKVLPNRTMIIVTKDTDYTVKDGVVVHSCQEAMKEALSYGSDVYVLGGGSIYKELLECTDEVHVTAVDYNYSADSYFPNLDKLPEWVMVDESEEQTHFDVVYYFRRYLKRKDYKPELGQ